jgi:C-terminal binding protein
MTEIAITDYFNECEIEKSILGDLVGLQPDLNTEVLLVWHKKIDKNYIESLPKLRAVQRYGVGYDTLDLEYLKRRNIICCNNPDYGVDEVSDTTIAMIMNIARGVYEYNVNAKTYQANWQENIQSNLRRTSNMTLGVIGAGRIGGSVVLKGNAMGFQTVIYDPYQPRGLEKTLKTKRVDTLEQLLKVADIISLHCPLTKETLGLVDESFILKMKMGSSLVNTARGGLVKSNDLIYNALKSGKLYNCALDVLINEPPHKSDKLINAWRNQKSWIEGRLIINPHSSYYSSDSILELRKNAAENALKLFKGIAAFNRII